MDSLRIEPCKSNHFTGSRYSRYTSAGCVNLLRFECKAESFHWKSIFLVYKYGGVKLLRFESIQSIRCESNLVSRITLPEVDIPGIQVRGV